MKKFITVILACSLFMGISIYGISILRSREYADLRVAKEVLDRGESFSQREILKVIVDAIDNLYQKIEELDQQIHSMQKSQELMVDE